MRGVTDSMKQPFTGRLNGTFWGNIDSKTYGPLDVSHNLSLCGRSDYTVYFYPKIVERQYILTAFHKTLLLFSWKYIDV